MTTYYSATWRSELLSVLELDIYPNNSDNNWWIKITAENKGDISAEIYKIEIHAIETIELSPPKTISPGQQKELYIKLSKTYSYGTIYTVRLYLKTGTQYPVLEKIISP